MSVLHDLINDAFYCECKKDVVETTTTSYVEVTPDIGIVLKCGDEVLRARTGDLIEQLVYVDPQTTEIQTITGSLNRAMVITKRDNHRDYIRLEGLIIDRSKEFNADLVRIPIANIRGFKGNSSNPDDIKIYDILLDGNVLTFSTLFEPSMVMWNGEKIEVEKGVSSSATEGSKYTATVPAVLKTNTLTVIGTGTAVTTRTVEGIVPGVEPTLNDALVVDVINQMSSLYENLADYTGGSTAPTVDPNSTMYVPVAHGIYGATEISLSFGENEPVATYAMDDTIDVYLGAAVADSPFVLMDDSTLCILAPLLAYQMVSHPENPITVGVNGFEFDLCETPSTWVQPLTLVGAALHGSLDPEDTIVYSGNEVSVERSSGSVGAAISLADMEGVKLDAGTMVIEHYETDTDECFFVTMAGDPDPNATMVVKSSTKTRESVKAVVTTTETVNLFVPGTGKGQFKVIFKDVIPKAKPEIAAGYNGAKAVRAIKDLCAEMEDVAGTSTVMDPASVSDLLYMPLLAHVDEQFTSLVMHCTCPEPEVASADLDGSDDGDAAMETFSYAETDTIEVVHKGVALEAAPYIVDTDTATVKINVFLLAYLAVLDLKENVILDADGVLVALPDLTEFAGALPIKNATLVGGNHTTNSVTFTDDTVDATVSDYSASVAFALGTADATLPVGTIGLMIDDVNHDTHKVRNMRVVEVEADEMIATVALCSPVDGAVVGDVASSNFVTNDYMFIVPGYGADVIYVNTTFNPPIAVGPELDNDSVQDAMAAVLDNPTLTDDSYVMLAENVGSAPNSVVLTFTSGSSPAKVRTATLTPDMMIRIGDASNMASVPAMKYRFDNILLHVAVVARLKELMSDVGGTISMEIHGETITSATLEKTGIFNVVNVRDADIPDPQHDCDTVSRSGNVVTVKRYYNTTSVRVIMDYPDDIVGGKSLTLSGNTIPDTSGDITSVITSTIGMVTSLPTTKFTVTYANAPTEDGIIQEDSELSVDTTVVTLNASADVRVIWEDHATSTIPVNLGVSKNFNTAAVAQVMNAVIDAYGPNPNEFSKTEDGVWVLTESSTLDPLYNRHFGAVDLIEGISSPLAAVDFVTEKSGVSQSHMITFETAADDATVVYPSNKTDDYFDIPIGPGEDEVVSVPKVYLEKRSSYGKWTLRANMVALHPLMHEAYTTNGETLKAIIYGAGNAELYSTFMNIATVKEKLSCEVKFVGGWHELPPENNSMTVTDGTDCDLQFEAIKYDTAFATRHKWSSSDPDNYPIHGYFVYSNNDYATAKVVEIVKVGDDGYVEGYTSAETPANVEVAMDRALINTQLLVFPTLYVPLIKYYTTLKVPTFKGKEYLTSENTTSAAVQTAFNNIADAATGVEHDETDFRVEIMDNRFESRPTRVVFRHSSSELPSGVNNVIAVYRPGYADATSSDNVSKIVVDTLIGTASNFTVDAMYTEKDTSDHYNLTVNSVALVEVLNNFLDTDSVIYVDVYTSDAIGAEPAYRTQLIPAMTPSVADAAIAKVEGSGVLHTTPPYNNTVELTVDGDVSVITISRFDTGYTVKAEFSEGDAVLANAVCLVPTLETSGDAQGDHTVDSVTADILDSEGKMFVMDADVPPADLTASSSYTGNVVNMYLVDPVDESISHITHRVDIRNKITESARPLNPASNCMAGHTDALNTIGQRYVYVEQHNGTLPPPLTDAENNGICVPICTEIPADGSVTSVSIGVYKTSDDEKIFSHTYEANFDGVSYAPPTIDIRLKTNPDADLGTMDAYQTIDNGDGTIKLNVSIITLMGAFARVGQSKRLGRDEYYAVDVFTTASEHYHHQIKIPFTGSNPVIDMIIAPGSNVVGEGGTHNESPYVNKVSVRSSGTNTATFDVVRYDTGYGVKVPISGSGSGSTSSSNPVKEWVVATMGGTEEFVQGKGFDVIYLERTDAQGYMYLIPSNINNSHDITDVKETALYTQWVFAPIANRFNNYWCGRINFEGTLTELPPKSPDLSPEFNEMSIRTAFANLNGKSTANVVNFTEDELNGLRVPVLDHVLVSKPLGVVFKSSDGDVCSCYNGNDVAATTTTFHHYTGTSIGSAPIMTSEANVSGMYDLKVSAIAITYILTKFTGPITAHIYNDTAENTNAYTSGTLDTKDGDVVLTIPDIFADTAKIDIDSLPMTNGTLNYTPKNYASIYRYPNGKNIDIDVYRFEKAVTSHIAMKGVLNSETVDIDLREGDPIIYVGKGGVTEITDPLSNVGIGGLQQNGYIALIQGDATNPDKFTEDTNVSTALDYFFAAPPDREVGYIGALYIVRTDHTRQIPTLMASPAATNIWGTEENTQIKEVLSYATGLYDANGVGAYPYDENLQGKAYLTVAQFDAPPVYVQLQQINSRYEVQNNSMTCGYPVGEENEVVPGDSKVRLHLGGTNSNYIAEMDAVEIEHNSDTSMYTIKVNIFAFLEAIYAAIICKNDFRFVIWFNSEATPVWVQVNHANILTELAEKYASVTTPPVMTGSTVYSWGGYHNSLAAYNQCTSNTSSELGTYWEIARYDTGYTAYASMPGITKTNTAQSVFSMVNDTLSNKHNDIYLSELTEHGSDAITCIVPAGEPPVICNTESSEYWLKNIHYLTIGTGTDGTYSMGYVTFNINVQNKVPPAGSTVDVAPDYSVEGLSNAYSALVSHSTGNAASMSQTYIPIVDSALTLKPVAIRLCDSEGPYLNNSEGYAYFNDGTTVPGSDNTTFRLNKLDSGAAQNTIKCYDIPSSTSGEKKYGISMNIVPLLHALLTFKGDIILRIFSTAANCRSTTARPEMEVILPNITKSLGKLSIAESILDGGFHDYAPECNTATLTHDAQNDIDSIEYIHYDNLGTLYARVGKDDGGKLENAENNYILRIISETSNPVATCNVKSLCGEDHDRLALQLPNTGTPLPTSDAQTTDTMYNFAFLRCGDEIYGSYLPLKVVNCGKISAVRKTSFNFGISHYNKKPTTAYNAAQTLLSVTIPERYESEGGAYITDEEYESLYMEIGSNTLYPVKPLSAATFFVSESNTAVTPESISGNGERWYYPIGEEYEKFPGDSKLHFHTGNGDPEVIEMPVFRSTASGAGGYSLEVNVLSLLRMIDVAIRNSNDLKMVIFMVNAAGETVTRVINFDLSQINYVTRFVLSDVQMVNSMHESDNISLTSNKEVTLTRSNTATTVKVKLTGDNTGADAYDVHKSKVVCRLCHSIRGGQTSQYHDIKLEKTDVDGYVLPYPGEDPGQDITTTETLVPHTFDSYYVTTYDSGVNPTHNGMYGVKITTNNLAVTEESTP